MTEPNNDDLRRRLERLEGIQSELQALMRETTLMIARLNETLLELKSELKQVRESHYDTVKEQVRQKVSLLLVQWIGGTVGTGGIGLLLMYLFKSGAP